MLDRLKKNPEKFEKVMLLLKFGMLIVNLTIIFGLIAFVLFFIFR